jgi:polyhydroxyalkanoate synthesis regulator phasin
MAETNILKRYLDAGMAFTAMTQARAEELIKELVKTGEIQTENAQAAITDLVERSRRNTEDLLDQVRRDIATSAESLGLATVADLTRIEKLIEAVTPGKGGSKVAKTTTATKKAATKKTGAAKKTAAKKTTATKKATTKKATATKKTAAKKTGAAKKTAAKKTSATKS